MSVRIDRSHNQIETAVNLNGGIVRVWYLLVPTAYSVFWLIRRKPDHENLRSSKRFTS